MHIDLEEKNGILLFKLSGNVDLNTSPELKKTFDKKVIGENSKVIINLKGVDYIDSSGLATFIEIYKVLRAHNGKLKLSNLSSKVKGLFEITKLDKLFDIVPTEEEAVTGF